MNDAETKSYDSMECTIVSLAVSHHFEWTSVLGEWVSEQSAALTTSLEIFEMQLTIYQYYHRYY